MTYTAIQQGVEKLLGGHVPRSSVKNALLEAPAAVRCTSERTTEDTSSLARPLPLGATPDNIADVTVTPPTDQRAVE
jgi:hypothetical protein